MKICKKCNKAYDDSWGVCLQCNETLIQGEKDQDKTPAEERVAIDKDKLTSARNRLKTYFMIWAISFTGIWIGALLGSTINNSLWVISLVMTLIFIIIRVFVAFQIRYVSQPMHKNNTTITLNQACAFWVPLGELIIVSQLMEESKKAIKDGWVLKEK